MTQRMHVFEPVPPYLIVSLTMIPGERTSIRKVSPYFLACHSPPPQKLTSAIRHRIRSRTHSVRSEDLYECHRDEAGHRRRVLWQRVLSVIPGEPPPRRNLGPT